MKTLQLQGARAHGRRNLLAQLRNPSIALLALIALSACREDPVQPLTNVGDALGKANGLVEITISGIGSDQMSSAARYVSNGEATGAAAAAPAGIARTSPMSG